MKVEVLHFVLIVLSLFKICVKGREDFLWVYSAFTIRKFIKLIMTAIMSNAKAVACVRRYLVEASVARGLGFFIMIGIKAIMFISKPIQASSQ